VWLYEWNVAGMLAKVIRPDDQEVSFGYDALGRRVWKKFRQTTTHFVWDGNVPLHEYKTFDTEKEQEDNQLTTWIFEEDNFIPVAKIKREKRYSVITDHLGTPNALYDEEGLSTWHVELDSYGRARLNTGSSLAECPFRYQGQYEDQETGLYYNRFRYYSPEEGVYISQDPIGLNGGLALYSYVKDTTSWLDEFGLSGKGIPFTDSKGLTLEVKNPQDLSHMSEGTLKVMEEEGFAGSTRGGRLSGSEKIVLHHQKQNPNGPIIELPASKHKLGNKKQHPFGNKKGAGVGQERSGFDNWRVEYWKDRATKELERRKIKSCTK